MEQYRTKSEIIEAIQLTATNAKEVADWCGGKYLSSSTDGERVYKKFTNADSGTFVFPGEWILKSKDGSYTKAQNSYVIDYLEPVSAPSVLSANLKDKLDEYAEVVSGDKLYRTATPIGRPHDPDPIIAELRNEIIRIATSLPLQREGVLQWVCAYDRFPLGTRVVAKTWYRDSLIVGHAASATGEMFTIDWGTGSITLAKGHEELKNILWLDESPCASPKHASKEREFNEALDWISQLLNEWQCGDPAAIYNSIMNALLFYEQFRPPITQPLNIAPDLPF